MSLKPEVKEKWVAALRSGDYAQTQNHLRDSKGFCCLGVLCELHRQEKPDNKNRWNEDKANIAGVQTYHGSVALLPCTVKKWADNVDDNLETLAWMNDQGKSFAEIADYIEGKY
jgi:hypothetical protein